jgi:hypothetical protein
MPEEEATASIAPYRYKQTISSCQAGRQAGGLGALSTWGLGWLRRRQGTL